MKFLLHAIIAVLLSVIAVESAVRIVNYTDYKPVYVMSQEPVVLTPLVNPGDLVEVRWFGFYRKACSNLRYTQWIGYYRDGEIILDKSGGTVPATSGSRTVETDGVFTLRLPLTIRPGRYFWRSVEIADCGTGVVHRTWLDDAWFEVVNED